MFKSKENVPDLSHRCHPKKCNRVRVCRRNDSLQSVWWWGWCWLKPERYATSCCHTAFQSHIWIFVCCVANSASRTWYLNKPQCYLSYFDCWWNMLHDNLLSVATVTTHNIDNSWRCCNIRYTFIVRVVEIINPSNYLTLVLSSHVKIEH